ncbi:MAG: hypothetical protein HYV97_03900 [Bdellovibrio sp.]|nr:hypothetical protein [Bdellovibrio sp.]
MNEVSILSLFYSSNTSYSLLTRNSFHPTHEVNVEIAASSPLTVLAPSWGAKKRQTDANCCPNNQIIKSYFESPRAEALPRYAPNRVFVAGVAVAEASVSNIAQTRPL